MADHSGQTLKDFEQVRRAELCNFQIECIYILNQESFVLDKYVEKLTQLDPNTGLGPLKKKEGMPFDPKVLLKSFQVLLVNLFTDSVFYKVSFNQASLRDLQNLNDNVRTRVEKYEFLCSKQEREHAARVRQLDPVFQVGKKQIHLVQKPPNCLFCILKPQFHIDFVLKNKD